MNRKAGFTLTELLVCIVLTITVMGAAISMSRSAPRTDTMQFDEQLTALLIGAKTSARAQGTPVTFTVTGDRIRSSAGPSLALPPGVTASSSLSVPPTGPATGAVYRVIPDAGCLQFLVLPYGTVERTSC